MAKNVWILLLFCVKVIFSQETGFFWQITDLHYDPWYTINQESCNKNLSVLGKYGDFECDAPWELVKSSVKAMEGIGREPEFILWSGDNPPHVKNYDVLNEDVIMELTQNITDIIMEAYPNTMVLPVLGNHDFYPKNQLPGSENAQYEKYVQMWDKWLNTTDIKNTFRKGAYFTRMLSNTPKVRAMVLNTNLYLTGNQATDGQSDPGGQFAWFDEVMNQARENGEKVHVFTHVPTGKVPEGKGTTGWLRSEQNDQLSAAFVRHSDVILGIYSAHAHMDTFKLFYNDDDVAVSSIFIPPSVTPWKTRLGDISGPPHNPALRKYVFDKSTYALLDMEQYFVILENANRDLYAEWIYLYSFSQMYHITDISVPQLEDLLWNMKGYASDEFHEYYRLNTVSTVSEDHPIDPCSCICKSAHLCAIEYVNFDEFDQCYEEQRACDPNYRSTASFVKSFGVATYLFVITVWLL